MPIDHLTKDQSKDQCINLGFTMECWAFFWQLLQSSSKLFKFSRRMLIQRKNFTLSALSWELLNGGYQD